MRPHLLVISAALLFLSASCATTAPGSAEDPDARDGEGSSATLRDARGRARIPSERQPTEDELAAAFDPSTPASSSAPVGEGNVSRWDPSPDPLEGQRAEFEAAVNELRAAIRGRAPEAPDRAEALVEASRRLGPGYATRALEIQLEAAIAGGQKERIAELALRWMRSCGPDDADGCRRKALRQLGRSPLKKQAAAIQKADACLRQAERSVRSGKLPPCLDEAERDYRRLDDDRMRARVRLVRARVKSPNPKAAIAEYERALKTCAEPRCLDLQRAALQQIARLSLQEKETEDAARAALREVSLIAQAAALPERAWPWTELATRTCAALDEEKGEGRCRALEKKLAGAHHFQDFSTRTAPGEGLSPDAVREVNAHFGFTLQPCLQAQAARLVPPAEERYAVRWVVRNDGRVIDMKMGRRDREDSPLAQCLREKLSKWRYPRYSGEYQHVEQHFAVSARAPLRSL